MANTIADEYYHQMDRRDQAGRHLINPEIGTTVHEGAEGKFTQSVAGKIWRGAGSLDLQLDVEQIQKGTGPGGYSKVARDEIKRLAELNKVSITSVHAPLTQGGYFNFTGLTERGFAEERRLGSINLLKRTIDFASDVSTEGTPIGITQHVGEFQRSLAHVKESKLDKYKGKTLFETKQGEEEEAIVTYVDDTSGKFQQIARNHVLTLTKRDEDKKPILDEKNQIQIRRVSWNEINKKYNELNNNNEFKKWINEEFGKIETEWKRVDPDEAFLKLQLQQQLDELKAQKERMKSEHDYHSRAAKIVRAKGEIEEAKSWQDRADSELKHMEELVKKEHEFKELIENLIPQEQAGLKRTASSLGEIGAYAFKIEKEKKLDEPIQIAPEIWTPEVYGSHPEEIAKIIEKSREEMIKRLTQKEIVVPGKVWDPNAPGKDGIMGAYVEKKVTNYFYREDLDPEIHGKEAEEKAKKIAEERIKMTFDTNHLATWWENFKPKNAEETEDERRKRFNEWYLEHLRELSKKGYIAHAHIVEGMEGSGMHLPPGEGIGTVPIKEAVEILREEAIKRKMHLGLVSEGHGEGPDRQLTEGWDLTGKPLYALSTGSYMSFKDVRDLQLHHRAQGPSYLFGEWSTSQDDFKSWSEVPLE